MHVRDFRYLRMSGIAGASDWDFVPKEQAVWNIHFPDNAIKFRLRNAKAEVVLQETVNVDSTVTLKFKQGAHAIILGNTFIYFEMELDKPNARYPF